MLYNGFGDSSTLFASLSGFKTLSDDFPAPKEELTDSGLIALESAQN